MRAFVFLIALSFLFPALTSSVYSSDILLWKSSRPTCQTLYSDGSSGPYGYATVWLRDDGTKYKRTCDFLGAPRTAMSDIGMPADGSFPINMTGHPEATHVKKLPNGNILLY